MVNAVISFFSGAKKAQEVDAPDSLDTLRKKMPPLED